MTRGDQKAPRADPRVDHAPGAPARRPPDHRTYDHAGRVDGADSSPLRGGTQCRKRVPERIRAGTNALTRAAHAGRRGPFGAVQERALTHRQTGHFLGAEREHETHELGHAGAASLRLTPALTVRSRLQTARHAQ